MRSLLIDLGFDARLTGGAFAACPSSPLLAGDCARLLVSADKSNPSMESVCRPGVAARLGIRKCRDAWLVGVSNLNPPGVEAPDRFGEALERCEKLGGERGDEMLRRGGERWGDLRGEEELIIENGLGLGGLGALLLDNGV